MDAKNVRKVSQIILNRFTELHKENYVKFSKECLPMLISGVSKDMYENYSYKFLSNEDTVNLLVNKTFELCKFVDNVRIQDVRSLYNMIYKVGLLRYENYDVNEKLNPANKWNECSENLINHYWETSEVDKKEFFKYLENVDYYNPEGERYPEYYIENGGSLVKVSKELILHLEGLNKPITYGLKKTPTSHTLASHLNCNKDHCWICDGGMSDCIVCMGTENTLTTDCCGEVINSRYFLNKFNEQKGTDYKDTESLLQDWDYMFGVWYRHKNITDRSNFSENRTYNITSIALGVYEEYEVVNVNTYFRFLDYIDDSCKYITDEKNLKTLINLKSEFEGKYKKYLLISPNKSNYKSPFISNTKTGILKDLREIVAQLESRNIVLSGEDVRVSIDYYVSLLENLDSKETEEFVKIAKVACKNIMSK